ncbi:MAG: indolepyruvate oxidoreductase subunit beta [Oscillospiraceae bacterium]|nr:indolepyruvate oxidoreductase subunit beta [Oscillospiraceae bacterium]
MRNILLAGVGGQGTVLASKLLAQAAMEQGKQARTAETIGMAQRGGCVVSHVRIGDGVCSPLIPHGAADVILGFEPAEAVRCLAYLKPDGVVVAAQKAIKPVTATLSGSAYEGTEMLDYLRRHVRQLIEVDGETICGQCGSAKVLNVALLGAAIGSGALELSLEQMEKTLEQRVPAKFLEMNRQALRLGVQSAQQQSK